MLFSILICMYCLSALILPSVLSAFILVEYLLELQRALWIQSKCRKNEYFSPLIICYLPPCFHKSGGHWKSISLSVCPEICLSQKLFWSIDDRAFRFGIYDICDKIFPIVLCTCSCLFQNCQCWEASSYQFACISVKSDMLHCFIVVWFENLLLCGELNYLIHAFNSLLIWGSVYYSWYYYAPVQFCSMMWPT